MASYCRKARRLITTFFNPEGLQTFIPRMDAITRDHMAKHWEGRDSIRGVTTLKEFTFAVACDLFVSLKDIDPRFPPLLSATEDFLGGIFQIPINLPGTAYRKGRLGRNTPHAILETLIAERKQVRMLCRYNMHFSVDIYLMHR
jgi:cytochrome P450